MNKKFNQIKLILYPFIYCLYYWSFFIVVILLIHNMIESDSFFAFCDNGNNSTDQFFVSDTDQSSNINNNESRVFSDSSSYSDVYCLNILDRYKNIAKRKTYWFVAHKGKGNFASYEDFKKSWDPNMDVVSELKKQFKSEVETSARKLSLAKRSLAWFIRGSKPGGGRGL